MRRFVPLLIILSLLLGFFLLYNLGVTPFGGKFKGEIYPPKDSIIYVRYNLSGISLKGIIDESFLPLISYTDRRGELFITGKDNSLFFTIHAKKGRGDELILRIIDEAKRKSAFINEKRVSSLKVYEITFQNESLYFIPQSFYITNLGDLIIFTSSTETLNRVLHTGRKDSLFNLKDFKDVVRRIPTESILSGYFQLKDENIEKGGFYTEREEKGIVLKGFYDRVESKEVTPLSREILRFIGKKPFFIFGIRGIGEILSKEVKSLEENNPLILSLTGGFNIVDFLSLFKNEVVISLSNTKKIEVATVSNLSGVKGIGKKIEEFKEFLKDKFDFSFKNTTFEDSNLIVGENPTGIKIGILITSNFLFIGTENGVKEALIHGKERKEDTIDSLKKEFEMRGNLTSLLIFDLKNIEKKVSLSRIIFLSMDREGEGEFRLKIEFEKD